ncbi:carbohydrate ABC transporter permease [Roseibium aggregatum]|uniref:carbohydrate ABC transporter permease n=1 Tax=Roseibium aggregatum TaxID=187304 RepID=UPI001E478735|nr:carbohydrate ABC transporter permease [Roseibium aggregatum]UES41968.1 ABC transporter permease subunit [Roseibium aggregatum]
MPHSKVITRALLLIAISLYTAFSAGPFAWTAMLSLRTTSEISKAPYAWPESFRWQKYVEAWTGSNYDTYFLNSMVITVLAVLVTTIVGAMAAHCLARYRFRGNRLIYFIIFSTIIFPPQITIIALFQTLVDYGLYNSRIGLILVYVSVQLPLTVFLLEGFFARLPQDLFDAARMDGYSDAEIFWKITVPIGMPAIVTTVILNTVHIWNEFLYAVVLISDESKRTLPLGIQKFMGDQLEDIGMIATGMMIAVIPIVIVYAIFSEKLIQGMTAGAVK